MTSRVLIVDDSPKVRQHIRAVLERESLFDEYVEAADGMAAFKLILDRAPDMVICDLVMPGIDGIKLLALVGARPDLRTVPFLMLTGENDSERKADLLDRGAADYVTKPFHEKELIARVRVHRRIKQLQDELRAKNAALADLVVRDPLTGLYNRRELDRRLRDEIARHDRHKTPLGLVMVDADHFKSVNDRFGHATGDAVLRGMAEVIASSLRETDVAARVGGEEFVVLLPHTGLEGARALASRLRVRLADKTYATGTGELRCTASLGVAALDRWPATATSDDLLAAADGALYRAKSRGRNRVEAEERTAEESTGGDVV